MSEKESLTTEDIRFLKALRQEMLTQDKCSQAAPRYWGIIEETREYGIEDGYEDDCELYRIGTDSYIDSMKEAAEEIRSRRDEILSFSDFDEYDQMGVTLRVRRYSDGRAYGHKIHVRFSNRAGDEDEYDLYDLGHVMEFLNDTAGLADEYRLANYKIVPKVVQGPIFLTRKAAQEYCDKYGYNHHNPHPYAMTAYRSPQIERLVNIIEQTDWSDVFTDSSYIATKKWSEEDVRDKLIEMGYEGTDEQITKVINSGYLRKLEDCTDVDWYIIEYAIQETLKRK